MPLAAKSQKQPGTAHSTPEAEIIAADMLRNTGVPALGLWETVLRRTVDLEFREGNAAACLVMASGRNPTMRTLHRAHRVNVNAIHQLFNLPSVHLFHQPTDTHAAYFLTT